ncbi:MAG TPA: alpha/beta hydrolase [Rubricoccaceae bacterium]|jgi:pimeloyl-ACP methyl ester carboxylesterase|nr:alpha/beta hydrolase [Rubricoccaceae bacterium]
MNTAHSDVRFGTAALATGVRLHYAEAGPPDGEPVLFLHGLSDSWFSFSPVLPHLPPSLRALALSQRGHGDSERPPAGYTKADLAADVVAFLDAMGIARATVVGHSMGSAVAQRVAASYPERVARLVLAGSYVTARTEDLLALNEEIRALTDPVPDALARAFQHSTIHRPLPEVFVDAVVAESLKLPARVWQAAMAATLAYDGVTALTRIQAPTMILWGDRDAIFSRAQQDGLLRLIPNATLKVYEETGHALHWERPERFAEDVAAFAASTPPFIPRSFAAAPAALPSSAAAG